MQEIRTAYTLDELKEVLDLLEKEGIVYEAKEKTFLYENVYTNNPTNKKYVVLVNNEDAQRSLDLLNTYYSSFEDDTTFLQKLDNGELIEMLAYPKQYSDFEVTEAKKIILSRGLSEAEINSLIETKIAKDNMPQPAKTGVIVAGYIFAIGGVFIGVVIAWYLIAAKATHTVTGEKYYAHTAATRFQGKMIMVVALLAFIFYIATFSMDSGFIFMVNP